MSRVTWLLPKVIDLLVVVARSEAPSDDRLTDAILTRNLFEVLVSLLDLMGKVETRLLWNKWGHLSNSTVVKEVEADLGVLKDNVVSVALTERVKTMGGYMTDINLDIEEVDEELGEVRQDVGVVKEEVDMIESRVRVVESRVDGL